MPESTSIFPCWGRHSRMGHNVIIGHFETFAGTSVICRVPELPADLDTFKLGKPEGVHIVPMEGPAFFGFELLSETTAMGLLLAGRATDWEAHEESRRTKRLTDSSVDAEEVPNRYPYAPADCPTCGGVGKDPGGCPDCGGGAVLMRPIYIAAPYAPRAGLTIIENITRAHALARHAMRLGYAPVVIHGAVQAGVYGNDDDPTERARGIEAACAIAAAIGRAGGELWILTLPDGGVSSGCEREEEAFIGTANTRVRYWRMEGLDGAIGEVR